MLISQVPGMTATITVTLESRKAYLNYLESSVYLSALPYATVLMDSLRLEIAQYEKLLRVVE